MRTHMTRAALVATLLVTASSFSIAQTKPAPKPSGKPAAAATAPSPFEPRVGQSGKDVVWVPSPQALVDRMLDMAKLTPKDFLMDLGSGDGITVITAAKRGARAMGIEYEPQMVELSKKNAQAAGMADRATFMKADLFETDLSKADVITMFLLPSINMRLRPTILELKPGTRVVANTFDMEDWEADEQQNAGGNCTSWCTALLWIVPAKVQGVWQTPQGELTLTQHFQFANGTLGGAQITDGRLRGEDFAFSAGGGKFQVKVSGTTMTGTGPAGAFTATKKN